MSATIGALAFSASLQAILNALFGGIGQIAFRPLMQKLEATGFFNLDAHDIIGQYGEDLVEKAKREGWTGVAGREQELANLILAILRRENPCLTGEAGVGKTALVEGLAAKIASGDVPEYMKDWVIIKIDFPSLIVGKGYGSDANAGLVRLRALLEYAVKNPNVIIFIDEIHQFSSYADLCKTYLDRHQIRLVGATTNREFEKYIAPDPALERRFTRISLSEPKHETAVKIVKSAVPELEKKYNVTISDEIVDLDIALSEKYMPYKSSPDKELKNLEAAACLANEERTLADGTNNSSENNETSEKDQPKTDGKENDSNSNDKKDNSNKKSSTTLKKKPSVWKRIKDWFAKKFSKKDKKKAAKEVNTAPAGPPVEITESHLRRAIEIKSGVPVETPSEEESVKLLTMGSKIKKQLIGQDKIIDRIQRTLIRARLEANNPDKIRGAFLFAGPSGTGKTFLINLLSSVIYPCYVLDAAQFKDELRTQVLYTINSHPYCMLVFEGIDAAETSIQREIAGIIERGYALDYKTGSKVSFKNAVIVTTVNTGAVDGHNRAEMAECLVEKLGYDTLYKLGDLLIFKSLTEEQATEFVTSTMDALCTMAGGNSSNSKVTYDDSATQTLVDMATSASKGGMRKVTDSITELMSDLGDAIQIAGDKGKILITSEDDSLEVKIVND